MGCSFSWPSTNLESQENSPGNCLQHLNSDSDWAFVAGLASTERQFLQHGPMRWLLSPHAIKKQMRDNHLALYGIFQNHELACFQLLRMFQEEHVAELAFCCTHPVSRKSGVASKLTEHVIKIFDKTNAGILFSDAVCTHDGAQKILESHNFFAFGILPIFESIASIANPKARPENLVRYVRFKNNNPEAWFATLHGAKLTPHAATLMESVVFLIEKQLENTLKSATPVRKVG